MYFSQANQKIIKLVLFTFLFLNLAFLLLPTVTQAATARYTNGRILYVTYTGSDFDVYTANEDGSGATSTGISSVSPSWSWSGGEISYYADDGGGNIQIETCPYADCSSPVATTLQNIGATFGLDISPDGSKFAFDAQVESTSIPDIWTINTDGSSQTNLTNNGSGVSSYGATWSPDGTKILYASNVSGNNDIWVMNADGSGKTNLTPDTEFDTNPAWSPDGSRIAFERAGSISIMNTDGSGITEIYEGGTDPVWSPDGSKIAIVVNDGESHIWTIGVDGSNPTQISDVNSNGESNPDWQPVFDAYCPDSVTSGGVKTSTVGVSEDLSDCDYDVISNEILTVDGALGSVNVDGVLKGNGQVGDASFNSGSTLDPGASPGCLATGDLTLDNGATFIVEIDGTTVCSEYDQTQVSGSVTLTDPTLSIDATITPAVGDVFIIIDNDQNDAVSGTFSGLPEGATVVIDGVTFTISYVGGDGNDIALSVTSVDDGGDDDDDDDNDDGGNDDDNGVPTAPNTGSPLLSMNTFIPALSTLSATGLIGRAAYLKRFKK